MTEQTFRSPGFFEREIDLSGRTKTIEGVPAGVIGPSLRGPAFVPVTVGSFLDFERKFGTLDPELFGPYAVDAFLRKRTALTYVRVLGAGANTTTGDISITQIKGTVKNAGFRISGSRAGTTNGTEAVIAGVSDDRHEGAVQFIAASHDVKTEYESVGYPIFTDNQTFDVAGDNRGVTAPTTFDLTFVFTVEAYSSNTQVSVDKVFSITVDRQYNKPYENLYIQAMPPQDDRDLVNSLLQSSTIIPPTLLYRGDDPNFGRATKVVYQHAFGLTAATYEDYVSSLYENHYWKNLILGSIETAQATDDNGNVIYEVVYSRVIGGFTNDQGKSVSKEVVLPYPIDPNTPGQVDTVFPNSLENMRNQVIDTVGQVSALLPRWMLSTQTNGRVLGFTPAWVIAYVTPGNSKQIAYNIRTQFGTQLNLVDFEVDRYELDRALTSNWDPVAEQWIPQPPSETTFDDEAHYQVPENFVFNGGSGYAVNDKIKILGSQVGGIDITNDIVITVQQVNGIGTIQQAIAVGTAPLLSVGSTYSTITGSNIIGAGAGATWDIEVTGEDPTVFDGGSLRFTYPTVIATDTTDYDKYLVFPYRTILG